MDATHGTNAYRFHLITLLVVDDFGEGMPVAWCISNHEDEHAIAHFLEEVHRNGNGAVLYNHNGSCLMMQVSTICLDKGVWSPLLCNWHVERAWRTEIKVGDSDLEQDIYKQLKTLMEEPERETFEKLLLEVCNDLKKHNKTKEFASYFERIYACRKNQWALCYRSGSGVNTNMYVEAFHRVLKYVYLHGHVNRRLDTLVFILLKFARDNGFDRLIKLSKGKAGINRTEGLTERE